MVSALFVGVIISEDLKWKEHTNVVSNKVIKSIGVLNKIRYILPVNVLSILCCTLILPYYQYCNNVWASDYPTNLHKLYMLLKRAIRITSQVKWRDHTSILFKRNMQLNIFDINKFQIVCFMYKFNSNLLPVNFNMFFQTNEQIHHHDTCGNSNIYLISHNTITRSFSIRVQGPLLWNSLDPLIKQCKSLTSFKNTFNRHLLSLYEAQKLSVLY